MLIQCCRALQLSLHPASVVSLCLALVNTIQSPTPVSDGFPPLIGIVTIDQEHWSKYLISLRMDDSVFVTTSIGTHWNMTAVETNVNFWLFVDGISIRTQSHQLRSNVSVCLSVCDRLFVGLLISVFLLFAYISSNVSRSLFFSLQYYI